MFAVAMLAILICMALLIARAFTGPTVFDRILAINSFGTKTVLLIAVLGFMTGRPDFLDLALVYALMNFIGTIAVLRFTRYGDLSAFDRVLEAEHHTDPNWP
ncbi:MAG: monovalent cation/H+ antiporter complex subunit F [Acidobacteriota bacterium]